MSDTLLEGARPAAPETDPEVTPLGEGRMVREDCWRQVHRLFHIERRSKSEIARQLALDRKTVRGILQEAAWQPYTRSERAETLLADHAAYLRSRAPEDQYSARILFQELRGARGYRGSYETVKRFVRPLRAVEQTAERAAVRFETPPGRQAPLPHGSFPDRADRARINTVDSDRSRRALGARLCVDPLRQDRQEFLRPDLRRGGAGGLRSPRSSAWQISGGFGRKR